MSERSSTSVAQYSQIGGDVALDLINTVSWRLDRRRRTDDLRSYADLLTFAQQTRLLADQERTELTSLAAADPRAAEAELDRLRRLRELTYDALIKNSQTAVDTLIDLHGEAVQRAKLRRRGARWEWTAATPNLRSPHDTLVRKILQLLTSDQLTLLHQCEDIACGWVYLDTSPRRNRRWCVAAECGNRNRARRFYARQRQQPAGEQP